MEKGLTKAGEKDNMEIKRCYRVTADPQFLVAKIAATLTGVGGYFNFFPMLIPNWSIAKV